MSDTYIIDQFERVVPYVDGRKSLDTREYRDATELELQQQKEIDELELEIRELESEAYDKRISDLEAKADAYDRLMSGGKKTLKEWANLTGKAVVITHTGVCLLSLVVPHIGYCDGFDTWDYNYEDDPIELPRELVDFTGDWKDSLTLPDGWEEKQ